MEQSKEQYNFFVDGKLNLQKLRHDISGTLFILGNAVQAAVKHPEKRDDQNELMVKESLDRLDRIVASLRPKGNLVEFIDKG